MTRDEVVQFIKEVQFGYLATIGADDSPCVRPISIKDVYGDDFYFFTFCTTRKVGEMEANPKVEVVWMKTDGASQVRVKGDAAPVTDEAIIERFMADNPMASQIIPPGGEHLFALYKIVPAKIDAAIGMVPYKEVEW